MKMSTTIKFEHSITCRLGFKFDISKIDKFKDLFGYQTHLEFGDNDTILTIIELHNNDIRSVSDELIFDCLSDLILKI